MIDDRKPRRFLDPRVLARLAAVPLVARKPMVGSVSGRHASPHRGSSVEFAEYRKYVPGDDLRRLDWRAFGRSAITSRSSRPTRISGSCSCSTPRAR